MTSSKQAAFEAKIRALPWGQRVGYRSRQPEAVIFACLLSGLLLWDRFSGLVDLVWPLLRGALLVHLVLSLVAFPLLVVPFWLSHRQRLKDAPSSRYSPGRMAFLRLSGQVLEVLLLVLMASGLWLVLVGNRGDLFGWVVSSAHLIVSLILGALLLAHAWRFTLFRRLFGLALLVAFAVAILLPASAWAQSGQPAPAPTSSSLVFDPGSKSLYSANFSAGSVSIVDAQSGERRAEQMLGGDIQRLALAPGAGVLAATDMLGGVVHILDLKTLAPKASVPLGGRPYGVIYDAPRDLFWITLFEGSALVGLSPQGKEVVRVKTAETPRGLALLADGRLLITHAMIGVVSIWDTKPQVPVLRSTIPLAEHENPDEFVSQGKPRLLDSIAISPDQTEAWLPHVLWNFDHPFQFQSTIYPAVSLLSLELGNEHEAEEHRKQLFLQINILEEGSRTRIVSNPIDAVFSADGHRVYVTTAGSEDLLVFDRSRAAPLGQAREDRRSRRANKLDQGGAKVVQIFRHLPGDNPRGVVVVGDDIIVQNAMSLDMSRLATGGKGPFARVTLKDERFAVLVAKDPLDPALRQGERLFHSGNTSDFPNHPMAGDNWMSCQSCHLDGFNFTNGYLFRDSKRDVAENAVVGHQGLKGMVAGDFVGDYLRMARDTQGGMGSDTRFETLNTDPAAPDAQGRKMMEDLHTYVTARQNLPFLATWMRIEANSPDGKTPHEKDWVNSAACRECHSEMFDQWADSNHRLMGESNPYYKVVEDLAAKVEGEEFRSWCMGCHQTAKLSSGWKASSDTAHMFEQGGASLIEAHEKGEVDLDEGTSCLMCHRITAVEDAGLAGGGNGSYTVNLRDRETYVFENDDNPVLKWLGDRQINAKPEVHKASYLQPFYKDPKLCGSCHGEFSPGTGAVIVNTYGEWLESPFNRPDDPSKNRTCVDCHMHADPTRIGTAIPGQSTDGGPVKDNVVTHQFVGANHHLVGLRNKDLEAQSIALLRTAATLTSRLQDQGAVVVRVANTGAGHKLPTGVADFRQMWLQVTVRDASGAVVVDSGHLDDGGVLDPEVRVFAKTFGRADGTHAGLVFWRHEKMLSDTRIPAGGYRDESYPLPEGTVFPVSVEARLMFRIYPQWVTDAVRAAFPELPNPPAVELNVVKTTFEQKG
jgi:DNA-binding beta-propeller fold protein YncE